ncbi:MAG: transposase [Aquabacterium sp.]
MARSPRLALPGAAHVVELLALPSSPWCADDVDRGLALDALRRSTADAEVPVHGYGLAADGLRWLCTPAGSQALSRSVQGFGRRYVGDHNRRHGRHGTLFAGRFRSAVVAPGQDALFAMLAVECPATAAEDTTGQLWTSLGHHLGRRRETWLTPLPAYWALGNTPFEREQAYAEAVARGEPGASWRAVLGRALRAGRPVGDAGFIEDCARRADRPLVARPRGRPRLR